MSLSPGVAVGPYEVVSRLGAGGMGEVWRARDSRLGREVAIKVLRADRAYDPKRVKRFEQEARAAGRMAHAGIVTVLDVGTHEGAPFVVTELLTGETLRAIVARGPLPPAEVLRIAMAMADTLTAAHDAGIVHRDLKPENVMRLGDGRIKLLDFGIAKLRASDEALPAGRTESMGTDTGVIVGTVGYMSPEQVRGEPVDARSDLFSLGAVLHELLGGRVAFDGEHDVERMMAIVREPPSALPSATSDEPPALRAAITRCLAKKPEDRFADARELRTALGATGSPATVSGVTRAAPARRRSLLALGAGVLGLVALVGSGGYLVGARKATGEALGRVVPMVSVPTGPAGSAPDAVSEAPNPTRPAYRRLTYRPGTVLSARFLPDGKTVVYGARWGAGELALYSSRVDSPLGQPLDLPASDVLGVSPSGELAVSLGRRMSWWPADGTLARVPGLGGTPHEVAAGVWSADFALNDDDLVVARRVAGRARLEHPLDHVLFETAGWIGDVRVSSPARAVAFAHHPQWGDDQGGVVLVDFAGKARTLVEGFVSLQGLAWSPAGDEIWFSGAPAGAAADYGVFAVTLGGALRPVLRIPGRLRLHDIAADGAVLLSNDDARAVTMARPPGARAETDLSWLDLTVVTALAPDGRSVLLSEQSAGDRPSFDVQWRSTAGSPPMRLGEGIGGDLSPDGRWALAATFQNEGKLTLLPVAAGVGRTLGRSGVGYRWARWLPDGRRILTLAAETGKHERLWLESNDGAPARALTDEGTYETAFVTADSRSLVTLESTGLLRIQPFEPGGTEAEMQLRDGEALGGESERGELYVFPRGTRRVAVELLDPRTARRRPYATIAPADPTGFVEVSRFLATPDGRAYAYTWYRQQSVLYLVTGLR
jgi:eukaryotic-like serine/threonine-protein kinase